MVIFCNLLNGPLLVLADYIISGQTLKHLILDISERNDPDGYKSSISFAFLPM